MALKRLLPPELKLARRTRVRPAFLHGVLLHVPLKAGLVGEPRPALSASVQLLPRVRPGMCGQSTESGEAFAALRAEVRPAVDQEVSVHQTLQSKRFVT